MADEDLCLSCPICMERYSDTHFPIVAPNCGHSICIDCGKKRKSNICVSCTVESFCHLEGSISKQPWPCNEWNKNFSLLDTVNLNTTQKGELDQFKTHLKSVEDEWNEFKTKYGRFIPDDIDYMECSSCKLMEKKERMKICGSCAEERNKEWKGMKEEEFVHLILCGFCCLKNHSGHVFIDYLPWKLDQLLTSTVTDGQSTVVSMDEICSYEVEKGKEQLENWNEKMGSFGSIHCGTYRDGLSIAKTLKLESDLVTRYSEDCLPPLRKFTKVVTDSSSRLDLLKGEIEDGTMGFEGSKAAKEEIVRNLEKPSGIDILKADYERRIGELEQQMAAAIGEESTIVHVCRMSGNASSYWRTGAPHVDQLCFSVSHNMYLCAVDTYGLKANAEDKDVMGTLEIIDACTSICSLNSTILEGSSEKVLQKLDFNQAVQICANKKYLIRLTIDKPINMWYGDGGIREMRLPGEQTVSFFDPPKGSVGAGPTNSTCGQFPGFYFRIDK